VSYGSVSAAYASASGSTYASGSASASAQFASGSIFEDASVSGTYRSSNRNSNYGTSTFNSTNLYDSAMGSFSLEGGSYTPISFNY
jgi:hypothetical protein